MAKAKPSEQEPDSPEAFAERAIRTIEEGYGEGVVVSGEDIAEAPLAVIKVSPSMDAITGGIQEGSWVGVTGNPKSCKTSFCLSLAAKAQRPENGSRPVFYAKVEGRLSKALLNGTAGLNLKRPHFNVIQSRKGRILSAKDFLDQLGNVLKAVPGAVVIIDSISALCDERELTDGVGTETRGGGAKMFSQWCRMMNQVVPVQRSIVLGITHLIYNTSGMGAQMVERGAQMWKYQKDYSLRTKQRQDWKVGERKIGYQVSWECEVSPTRSPGARADSFVRFGRGIDDVYEAVQFGTACGAVRKSGSWLSLDFLRETPEFEGKDVPKYQGGEAVCRALRERPDWYDHLAKAVAGVTGSEDGEIDE